MSSDGLSSNYQVLEELGSGSFGVVYKAIERSTGEIVAIKLVRTLIDQFNYVLTPYRLILSPATTTSKKYSRRYPS